MIPSHSNPRRRLVRPEFLVVIDIVAAKA